MTDLTSIERLVLNGVAAGRSECTGVDHWLWEHGIPLAERGPTNVQHLLRELEIRGMLASVGGRHNVFSLVTVDPEIGAAITNGTARCPYCGRTQGECDADRAADRDAMNKGACAYGPDCDGSRC